MSHLKKNKSKEDLPEKHLRADVLGKDLFKTNILKISKN